MGGAEEGGLEHHFVQLSNGLIERGVEVSAIAHPRYGHRFAPQVAFHPLDLSKSRWNPASLLHLMQILRRAQPAIVHAQANKAAAMLSAVQRWVPGKKVATVHNQKRSVKMFASMDALIGVSNGTLATVEHPCKRVIFNGLDAPDRAPLTRDLVIRRFDLTGAGPLVLAVGRLVPAKAFDVLLQAWDSSFGELLILGDGPDRPALEALIAERGLHDSVRLAGHQDDVRQIMPAADLLVCSSIREGFSYVLSEALLARLPILSTRVAGAVEVLPESQLVGGSPEQLRDALARALGNLEQVNLDMVGTFAWAEKELSTDQMVKHTHDFYLEIL
jgi:glycosyltransferase involved in cell wall biosynthesis